MRGYLGIEFQVTEFGDSRGNGNFKVLVDKNVEGGALTRKSKIFD